MSRDSITATAAVADCAMTTGAPPQAGAAVSLSSVSVIATALRLRTTNL